MASRDMIVHFNQGSRGVMSSFVNEIKRICPKCKECKSFPDNGYYDYPCNDCKSINNKEKKMKAIDELAKKMEGKDWVQEWFTIKRDIELEICNMNFKYARGSFTTWIVPSQVAFSTIEQLLFLGDIELGINKDFCEKVGLENAISIMTRK